MRHSLLLALPLLALAAGCPLTPFDPPNAAAGGSGGGGCQDDAACDDQNPCTVDRCEAGTCASDPAAMGAACGEGSGDKCQGGQACDGAGQCVTQGPIVIDDGNACTTDACDPSTGAVSNTKIPGCVPWTPTSEVNAPSPRYRHTAVWTGSKMIVWGGYIDGDPSVTDTGGVYDPATNTWTPTSTKSAPAPRYAHSAVWTGSRMVVWGGFGASSYETSGGIYDPATDTWEAMTSVSAPTGRAGQADVWTGKDLFVWGGIAGPNCVASGGIYDPALDDWSPLPPAPGFEARYGHSAILASEKVILWGGNNTADWLKDGIIYSQGAWEPMSSPIGIDPRDGHTAVWTGSQMIIWGGFNGFVVLSTGGLYDPATDTWTETSVSGEPAPRDEHAGVWTGSAMVVWGGCGGDACKTTFGDGGIYKPDASGGTWEAIVESPALGPRREHTAVWTGSSVIIWGGTLGNEILSTGAQAPF